MPKKVDISVIILSHNTEILLRACLISLLKARRGELHIQTIVVDNASTDRSIQIVKKEFPWVELVESRKNLGYSGGNNLGLKKVKGEYILFLNSDVEIKPIALVRMKQFMDRDAKIGASTPKVELFRGGMDPDCHRGFPTPLASLTYFLGLEKVFPKSRIFGQYHQFYLDLEIPHEIDSGFGTFMFVRSKTLKMVGNWDERYFFYGEDIDLFYRIKQAGWKVMYYPETLALHHKGASSGLRKESRGVTVASKEIRLKTAKASIEAMEIFYKKFYKGKYNSLITMIVLAGIKIKGLFRLLKFSLSF